MYLHDSENNENNYHDEDEDEDEKGDEVEDEPLFDGRRDEEDVALKIAQKGKREDSVPTSETSGGPFALGTRVANTTTRS